MTWLTEREQATSAEVFDQYTLTPAQRKKAEKELNSQAREFEYFNAYDAAHSIAAKLERK